MFSFVSKRSLVKSFFDRRTHTLINHSIYPLHDRQSDVYRALLVKSREEFHTTGCLYLPKFLTPSTLSTILEEINEVSKNSSQDFFHSVVKHTENLYDTDSKKPTDTESSRKTVIAFDQIPDHSLLRRIYSWSSLVDFIVETMSIYPQLYQSADPLGALYVNIYRQSNQLSWHTDHSHFFVNLLLQQPSIGTEGCFQYKTNEQVLVSRDDFQAGGLVLFNGRQYPHRVTEVRLSKEPRINAILTYDCQPNHYLSDYILMKFFGRRSSK